MEGTGIRHDEEDWGATGEEAPRRSQAALSGEYGDDRRQDYPNLSLPDPGGTVQFDPLLRPSEGRRGAETGSGAPFSAESVFPGVGYPQGLVTPLRASERLSEGFHALFHPVGLELNQKPSTNKTLKENRRPGTSSARDSLERAVAAACGVPWPLIGSDVGASIREGQRAFASRLAHRADRLAADMTRQLGVEVSFDASAVFRADIAMRARAYKAMVDAGMDQSMAAALAGLVEAD